MKRIITSWTEDLIMAIDNKKFRDLYYDNKSGFQVLGCLLKNPPLIKDKKFPLSTKDFHEPFHKYLFGAIYNLVMQNIVEITAVEIEQYLSSVSPKHYKAVFEDNDGIEWLSMSIEMSALVNFEYNYNRLKKFSLLRQYINGGIDIREILDQTLVEPNLIEEQNLKFNEMEISDIIRHFDAKMITIKTNFTVDIEGSSRKAGDDSYVIKDRLKNDPVFGLLFQSGYYNTISRGALRKKFIVRSAGSGVGKSRTALSELMQCCAVELWDYKTKQFVKNPNNPNGDLSGVYVGTEMELEDEVEIIAWATISGVPTERILENLYLEGEEERVDYAIDILQRSNIHLYDEPNYSIARLDEICEIHSVKDTNFFGLFFDYISITGEIMKEFMVTRKGMAIREDQVYLWISTECKNMAKKYDIYFSSSTQLNAKSSGGEQEKNAGMIRGSFALIDKADMGVIIMPPSNAELEKVADILKSFTGFNNRKPNRVEHIFKSRGTKFKEVRIWQYVDLGTVEITDMFVTGYDYKRININPTLPKPIV